MFTGIVESVGKVRGTSRTGSNMHIYIESTFLDEVYIDQSIAHNGVCLTVDEILEDRYRVTAIDETLKKSNLGGLSEGKTVNLERCLKMNGRIDGHMVQGHVDTTTTCLDIQNENGSWLYTFKMPSDGFKLVVDKGSICINGVSLTVVDPTSETFKVAIIPYTYEHTTFANLTIGDKINIEYDIIGKYVLKHVGAFAQMG